jgi:hypothetical protein
MRETFAASASFSAGQVPLDDRSSALPLQQAPAPCDEADILRAR